MNTLQLKYMNWLLPYKILEILKAHDSYHMYTLYEV